MDDGFDPILLVGNSTRSGHSMHEMFLGSKESLFGVYFASSLVPIHGNRFSAFGPTW
jgi:hypothetical protein